jgi:hypothetical protein
MPDSARKALEGLLAEGVDAAEVLDKLQGAGFKVDPPEGDESYGEEGAVGIALEVEALPDAEAPPSDGEGPPGPPMGGRDEFLKGVAKRSMDKNGYSEEE